MTDRKIIRLTAENFMRLKAISISPSGDMVYITGANGEGKSSILNAICAALNWRDVSGQIPEPIHQGEKKAVVSLDLGDMTITRTWTPSGTQLKVESKDGAVFKSPQAMLDEFFSRIGFDPLEFIRMQPRDQRQTLMDLLGIDFSEFEIQKERLLKEKNIIDSKVKSLEMQVSELPQVPEDTSDDEISAGDLIQQIQEAQNHLSDFNVKKQEMNTTFQLIQIEQERIRELEERIKICRENIQNLDVKYVSLKTYTDAFVPPDIESLKSKLSSIESNNQNIRIKKQHSDLSTRLRDAEADLDCIIEQIQDIDQDKRDTLESAKFPVKGLSFDESGVLYQGVSLKQASSAEQIRVSLAIGIAMNPSLKVLLIRDGSLLDSKSRELVADMAAEHGMQVWIEAVDESGQVGFMIEDGAVKPHSTPVSPVEKWQQVLT